MKIRDIKKLKELSAKIRKDTFDMIINAQSGHIGGSLSIIEILTVLYYSVMDISAESDKKDRLILSKGHGVPALYTTLAYRGLLAKEAINGLRKLGSTLQGHPDCKKVQSLDMSSGSLGQGLSVGIGFALGQKLRGHNNKTFVLLGDGELDEGQIWEAAMAAAHYKLDNLIAIVDRNGLQLDGTTDSIMSLGSIVQKFIAFGWNVLEVDGHDVENLYETFEKLNSSNGAPTVIIAKTVKGKGISFIENRVEYHGKLPNDDQYKIAMEELEKEVSRWEVK